MKKISVVLIAALVVSLLFGCGKSDDAKGTFINLIKLINVLK